jgi:glutamate N-acetyltransferase/amino-acid N-acetyltransferase
VDGDTSTNDCVIGLASGASGAPLISDAGSAEGKTLEAALTALLQVGVQGSCQPPLLGQCSHM